MRPAVKKVCFTLFFVFLFKSPLFPQDFSDNNLFDDEFFFEELFIFEELFMFGEFLMSERAIPDEEENIHEDTFFSDDTASYDELPFSTEIYLSEDTYSDEEMQPPDEETLLAEEDFFDDDDGFFFEASPLIYEVPVFQMRSFDLIFPGFTPRQKRMAMSSEGIKSYFTKDEDPGLVPNPELEIDLLGDVMKRNPSHLIEALVVVPYNEKEFDLLDIYNALGRIEKIKDQAVLLNGNDFFIFTESTRIDNSRSRRAIPDPLPAETLPFSETMYLRLKEFSFGNLFIRGEVSISMYGITYSMTNFTDVRYFLIPIMRAERFITMIYLEPVKEGVLIYSITGFYMPGFIADRVNLTANINRRIEVFLNWITDGLREQENISTIFE